ncbi:MAG: 30S ribosomal protein S7 [Candidatus Omnitrophota bacterium]
MRRRSKKKREIDADALFNSKIVAKFINMLMRQGKKSIAERIVYTVFERLKERTNEQDVLKVFSKAVDNVRPRIEVKARRVGGATYQVPIDVKHDRSVSIALRWMRDFALNRKGKQMIDKLTDEIFAAYNGEGASVKKRNDTHKMAESNKAFAHFRW